MMFRTDNMEGGCCEAVRQVQLTERKISLEMRMLEKKVGASIIKQTHYIEHEACRLEV